MPKILTAAPRSLAAAADLLRAGKLVAFPTETVYGLGADATNGNAVAAIYAVKGRPAFNPLIIHAADSAALEPLIEWNDDARLLAASLWPGPLTLVLRRKKDSPVSLLASAGLDSLAVRIPSHPVAQKLLRLAAIPIAAPSANASGKLSPTAAIHVAESLGDKVDLIIADGRTPIGIESTVVDLTRSEPLILRPGSITQERLAMVLGRAIAMHRGAAQSPAAPGMLASHYAPNLPLRLNADSVDDNEAYLAFGPDMIKRGAARLNLSPHGDLNEAAANLFAMLRELDKPDYKGIAVAPIPEQGIGVAINDRLKRAAAR